MASDFTRGKYVYSANMMGDPSPEPAPPIKYDLRRRILRSAYQTVYRMLPHPPWAVGPIPMLVDLVESGELTPGRALEVGCGTGDDTLFLARSGFEVTGVDWSTVALDRARRRLADEGQSANLVVDDVTSLQRVEGVFDLVIDHGLTQDLDPSERDALARALLPHTRSGSTLVLWCQEWKARSWQRGLPVMHSIEPGEIERRYSEHWNLRALTHQGSGWKLFHSEPAMYRFERK